MKILMSVEGVLSELRIGLWSVVYVISLYEPLESLVKIIFLIKYVVQPDRAVEERIINI